MVAGGVRQRLKDLLRREAVSYGDYVLSSGAHSTVYLDARLVTLSAAGSALVGKAFLELLPVENLDAVAGLTLGADPIVTAIAVTSSATAHPLDACIVRKNRKEHGAGRRIEGPWRKGLRVAIVDDTLTTGSSALEAAQAVCEAGGRVVGIYALIDREEGARGAIEAAGYPFESIFTAACLLDRG
ncbi:MAG: orotate phosphoribosyltransferase [Chloroflexota bacterium]